MSDRLLRAELVPYMPDGKTFDKSIALDFNPETLTIQVQSGQAVDRGRRGRQAVQYVGRSNTTLSFDAVFDTTRPSDPGNARPVQDEQLDVRLKTKPIADLLQVEDKDRAPAPRRVQFRWGPIRFNGILRSYNETLDFFSPEGVPLRSKVTIGITEQDFRYEVQARERAQARGRSPGIADAGEIARNNNLDSLFDVTAGAGFGFNAALDLELGVGAQAEFGAALAADLNVGFDVDLGISADLGASAGAGIGLSAGAAFDLFGEAAIKADLGVDADLGPALDARPDPAAGAAAGQPKSAWAPDGPRPGSQAAALAGAVNGARAAGVVERTPPGAGQFKAIGGAGAGEAGAGGEQVMPQAPVAGAAVRPTQVLLPVRGSPPPVAARFGAPPGPGLFSRSALTAARPLADPDRPSWERLPPAVAAAPEAHDPPPGCPCCGPVFRSPKPW